MHPVRRQALHRSHDEHPASGRPPRFWVPALSNAASSKVFTVVSTVAAGSTYDRHQPGKRW
ncbi:hypothetical protein [Nonomuraea sp. NPDC049625]|uniref:hypothetical protein n=1 Tax=Nonomuraea sp. NPDC049625 TaxID=3155775 RepID=UPI00341613C1